MTEDFNNLKSWLPDKIKATGLTMQEFAQHVRVSRATLYHWLTDKRRPDEATMKRVCTLLKVPLEEGLKQYTPRHVGRPEGVKNGEGKSNRLQSATGMVAEADREDRPHA